MRDARPALLYLLAVFEPLDMSTWQVAADIRCGKSWAECSASKAGTAAVAGAPHACV